MSKMTSIDALKKVIDELDRREASCAVFMGDEFYAGKVAAYRQTLQLLWDMIEEEESKDAQEVP